MAADNIRDLLDEDSVKGSVNELAEAVKDFGSLDAVAILWEDVDGEVRVRLYGATSTLVGILARAQHKVMHEAEV